MTDLRTAAQQALEVPEQEPVAWRFKRLVNQDFETDWVLTKFDPSNGVYVVAIEPLYTHPPRREWQRLSEEEIHDLSSKWVYIRGGIDSGQYDELRDFALAIEAALKELNP